MSGTWGIGRRWFRRRRSIARTALNISRYVLPPVGEDVPPLPEAVPRSSQAGAGRTVPPRTAWGVWWSRMAGWSDRRYRFTTWASETDSAETVLAKSHTKRATTSRTGNGFLRERRLARSGRHTKSALPIAFSGQRYRKELPERHFRPCFQMMASLLPESGLEAQRLERIARADVQLESTVAVGKPRQLPQIDRVSVLIERSLPCVRHVNRSVDGLGRPYFCQPATADPGRTPSASVRRGFP